MKQLGEDENLTDTVVAITVEIEAITAVTFEHKVVEIEAVLFTRVPIFTQTWNKMSFSSSGAFSGEYIS